MAIVSRDFRSLRLDGISRAFGHLNALHEVSLTVRRGEFIALLGPSGCGKSTALNCLAGLLPLTGGAIWLDEKRIDTLGPEDRGFGMVFQNYALFPHMTVRKNVGFGLTTHRVPKAEITRRVDEALALVRLTAQAEKLPGQLSGGQQQRVAIARAIVVEPPLVLMDEPLSNLDAKLRLEMRAEIRRIHQLLGCSTIYVTHDQDEALSLADRIVVLRDGSVRQIGTPEELYARPAHADVAEFMGYRNLVPTAAEPAGELVRVQIGGAAFAATPMEPIAGRAVAAIRPEDLSPAAEGAIEITVEAAEYRGRDFYGFGKTRDGTELFFRAEHRVGAGEMLRLSPPPAGCSPMPHDPTDAPSPARERGRAMPPSTPPLPLWERAGVRGRAMPRPTPPLPCGEGRGEGARHAPANTPSPLAGEGRGEGAPRDVPGTARVTPAPQPPPARGGGATVRYAPSLRTRLRNRGLDGVTLLVLPGVLFVVALFVYPFLYGLLLSFEPKQGGWLANYVTFFSDPFLYDTIGKTLLIAVPATLLNVVLSIPVAMRVRLMRHQKLLTTILVIPITLGTVLIAEGLLTYLGPRGWVNRVLLEFGLAAHPIRLVHNYWGVMLSLIISGFPFTFLLTLSYVTGIDPALENAGAMLGARARARFFRIILPLLVPGLVITLALSFVQAFSVFPSAVLLGAPAGPTRVISIAAYTAAFEQYDYSMASAIAMIMAAVQVLIVVALLGVRTLVFRGPASSGKG